MKINIRFKRELTLSPGKKKGKPKANKFERIKNHLRSDKHNQGRNIKMYYFVGDISTEQDFICLLYKQICCLKGSTFKISSEILQSALFLRLITFYFFVNARAIKGIKGYLPSLKNPRRFEILGKGRWEECLGNDAACQLKITLLKNFGTWNGTKQRQ